MAEPEQDAPAPDEEPAEAQATAPPPPPDGTAPADESDPDLDPDEDESQVAAAVWMSVAGDAIFPGANGDGPHRKRRWGRLDEAEFAEATRWFVEPPGIRNAVSDLRTNRLVVLAGQEGTGRRCAAIWLLKQVSSGDLVVIAPSDTVDQLARKKFKAHHGYLVADFVGGHGPRALHRFDADVLRTHLLDREAHLVITTSSLIGRRHFLGATSPWEPVTGDGLVSHVFDRYEHLVGPDERDQILRVCRNLSLADTRSVLDRLLDAGHEAALELAHGLEQRSVEDWFNDDPKEADVVRVAVAAYVPFCAKRAYEAHHARLRRLRRLWWGDEDASPEPLLQEHRELRRIELLETAAVPFATEQARPRVMPADQLHAAIVAEVHDRFGDDLLQPLQQLQDEASLTDDVVTQLGVARAISLLARVAPDDASSTLARWAGGPAAQRRTAAYALSWMCGDDATAALALRLAISWCSGAGTQRAVTAALAFGLQLSVRYPTPSVSHLWTLALRGSPIDVHAAYALTDLVRTTASARDEVDQVLRTVTRQMDHLLDQQPARYDRVRRGTEVIRRLLTAAAPDGEGTVTVHLLRTHPDLAERLGRLWAEVLCSRPHRQRAVLALREDLNRLTPGVDDNAVAALGAEIRNGMAPEQWEWLRRDLPGGDWHW